MLLLGRLLLYERGFESLNRGGHLLLHLEVFSLLAKFEVCCLDATDWGTDTICRICTLLTIILVKETLLTVSIVVIL